MGASRGQWQTAGQVESAWKKRKKRVRLGAGCGRGAQPPAGRIGGSLTRWTSHSVDEERL